MPSPLYNNASLAAKRPGKDFTVDIMKSPSLQAQILKDLYGDGVDPVTKAKAFLAKPSVLDTPDPEAAAYAERISTAPRQRASLKDFTDAAKMGGSLGLEAIENSPRDVNRLVRGAAGLAKWASPLYAVPAALSGIRQLIAPERSGSVIVPDEESRFGGAMELGGAVLGATGMINPTVGMEESAARAATRPLINSGPLVGPQPFREPPLGTWNPAANAYQRAGKATTHPNFQQVSNPNQVLDVARSLVNETGSPLESVLKGGRQSGISSSQRDALMKLAASGSIGPTARLADEAVAARTPIQKFYAENPMGEGRMTGQFTEGPGGLSSLQSLLPEKAPRPYRTAAELAGYPQVEADRILGRYAKPVPSPADVMGENLTTLGQPWSEDLNAGLNTPVVDYADRAQGWREKARTLKALMLNETDPAVKAAQKKTWDAYQVQARVARQKGHLPRIDRKPR